MPHVQNILKYLVKHYEDHKESKKKLTPEERTFCLSLINKIDSFCITSSQSDRQKFDKFKASGLSVAAYIKKYKINDQARFKRILKKFEGSCPISKYDQVKEEVHGKLACFGCLQFLCTCSDQSDSHFPPASWYNRSARLIVCGKKLRKIFQKTDRRKNFFFRLLQIKFCAFAPKLRQR